MKETMEALEILYREMGDGAAVTAPAFDVHSPTAAARAPKADGALSVKSKSGASPHFGTAGAALLVGYRRLARQRRRHAPREAARCCRESLDGHRYVV